MFLVLRLLIISIIKKVIGKKIPKTRKLNAIALNIEKYNIFLKFKLFDNFKRKYKAILKKDKNKTSLYKKLSPNILGDVINRIVPERDKKKLLNLSISSR